MGHIHRTAFNFVSEEAELFEGLRSGELKAITFSNTIYNLFLYPTDPSLVRRPSICWGCGRESWRPFDSKARATARLPRPIRPCSSPGAMTRPTPTSRGTTCTSRGPLCL